MVHLHLALVFVVLGSTKCTANISFSSNLIWSYPSLYTSTRERDDLCRSACHGSNVGTLQSIPASKLIQPRNTFSYLVPSNAITIQQFALSETSEKHFFLQATEQFDSRDSDQEHRQQKFLQSDEWYTIFSRSTSVQQVFTFLLAQGATSHRSRS